MADNGINNPEIYQLNIGINKNYTLNKVREMMGIIGSEIAKDKGKKTTLKITPDMTSLKDIKGINLNKILPQSEIALDFGIASQKDALKDILSSMPKDAKQAAKHVTNNLKGIFSDNLFGGLDSKSSLHAITESVIGKQFGNLRPKRIKEAISNIQGLTGKIDLSKSDFSQMVSILTQMNEASLFMDKIKGHKSYTHLYDEKLHANLIANMDRMYKSAGSRIATNGDHFINRISFLQEQQEREFRNAIQNHQYRLEHMGVSELQSRRQSAIDKRDKALARINDKNAIVDARDRLLKYQDYMNIDAFDTSGKQRQSTVKEAAFWRDLKANGLDKSATRAFKAYVENELLAGAGVGEDKFKWQIKNPEMVKELARKHGVSWMQAIINQAGMREFVSAYQNLVALGASPTGDAQTIYKALGYAEGVPKGLYKKESKIATLKSIVDRENTKIAVYDDAINRLQSGEVPHYIEPVHQSIRRLYKPYKGGKTFRQPGKHSDENVAAQTQQTKSSMTSEINNLSALRNAVKKVTDAVNEKTLAFEREGQAVSTVVANEISALTGLAGKVDAVTGSVNNLKNKSAEATKAQPAGTKQTGGTTTRQSTGKSNKKASTTKDEFKTYNLSELQNSGNLYIQRPSKSVEDNQNTISRLVNSYGKSKGLDFKTISVAGVEDLDGIVRSFKATADTVDGITKTLTFERARIKSGKDGKYTRYGLVMNEDNIKTVDNRDKIKAVNDANNSRFAKSQQKQIDNEIERQAINDVKASYKSTLDAFLKGGLNNKQVKQIKREFDALNNQPPTIANLKAQAEVKSGFNKYIAKRSSNIEGFKSEYDYSSIADRNGYLQLLTTLEQKVNRLREITKNGLLDGIKNDNKEINSLITKIAQTEAKLKSARFKPANETTRSTVLEKIANIRANDTRMSKEDVARLNNIERRAYGVESKQDMIAVNSELKTFQRNLVEADKKGSSFVAQWKKKMGGLLSYFSTFGSVYYIIGYVKSIISTVKEYNNALTEMRKVSNEGVATLKEYQAETFNVADEVATTAKVIQDSTADWMRLGESMEDAAASAKTTAKLFAVAEFENIDEASKGLVAVSQAYQNIDKDTIVDKINYIGNNYAIATNELTTGLQNAAAALTTQGNDLDEAIALVTAGNIITQDANKVSTGIRTISLRLAGTEEAKAQLDDLGEDSSDVVMTRSKLDETIKEYTAVASNNREGVSILDDNGNLRSTYEILLDISKVYKEIQEEDKKYGTNRASALVEAIAGKNRSNIAASILLNPEILESVYQDSLENSEGSADKELAKKLDSVDAAFNKLKNSADELWTTFLNSDVLKFITNIIDGIVEILGSTTKFAGTLSVIVGTIAAIRSAQGKGYFIIHSTNVKEALVNLYRIG